MTLRRWLYQGVDLPHSVSNLRFLPVARLLPGDADSNIATVFSEQGLLSRYHGMLAALRKRKRLEADDAEVDPHSSAANVFKGRFGVSSSRAATTGQSDANYFGAAGVEPDNAVDFEDEVGSGGAAPGPPRKSRARARQPYLLRKETEPQAGHLRAWDSVRFAFGTASTARGSVPGLGTAAVRERPPCLDGGHSATEPPPPERITCDDC